MILQNRRWRTLRSVIFSLTLMVILASPVTAKEVHWAAGSVKALVDLGIGGDELRQAITDVSASGLDKPISLLEWQTWVRQAVALEIGADWVNNEDTSFWIDAYTVPKHEGSRSVIGRGFVVAGLMKIGNLVGFIPASSQGPPVHLPCFGDWRKVVELGFDAMWESMLEAGIVSGYPDGTLRPEKPLTRAEAACLLQAWLGAYKSALQVSIWA